MKPVAAAAAEAAVAAAGAAEAALALAAEAALALAAEAAVAAAEAAEAAELAGELALELPAEAAARRGELAAGARPDHPLRLTNAGRHGRVRQNRPRPIHVFLAILPERVGGQACAPPPSGVFNPIERGQHKVTEGILVTGEYALRR
jgi:hypothetical protein